MRASRKVKGLTAVSGPFRLGLVLLVFFRSAGNRSSPTDGDSKYNGMSVNESIEED